MDNRHRKQRHDSESEAEKARYLIEESFREDKSGANAPKAFVKGGIIDPTSKMAKDNQKGDLYIPGASRGREDRKMLSAFEQAEANRPAPPPQTYAAASSKPRNIDKVAQEMKARRQAEMSQKAKQPEKSSQREPPREPAKFKGSNFSDVLPKPKEVPKDRDFMETIEETASIFGSLVNYHTYTFAEQSNASLVITNLPYNVQEAEIKQVLSSYGEIDKFILSGLKPTQDQPPRFVAFVKYKKESDAQAAKEALKKTPVKGVTVTTRWGQAAANVKSIKDEPEAFENKVYVRVPESSFVRKIIDRISRYVASDGHIIEQAIMEKERESKEFSFLYVKGSNENNYYRWRVFAFANGDNDKEWKLEPFRIYEGGPMWYPPPNLDLEEKAKKKTATGSLRLSDEKREQLEEILRNLTTDRKPICDAMAFCMDNADHSAEVVFIITEAIKNAETPIQKKIARLYLINDILYNSSLLHVQAAWSYRKFFEAKLPEIFEHLNKIPDTDMAKDKIMKILKIWNDWAIYDLKYLLGLEATFKRKPNPFGSSQSSVREGEKTNFIKETSEIGLKLRFIEEKLNDDSTKELEKTCRLNGLPTGGGRRDLIERILVLKDYGLRNNKDEKVDLGIQFETVEKKKIDVTTDLIKDYNKLLSAKQPPNLGLHEIEKMISGGLELLKFLQTRNEKIDEKDINGEPLDDLDFALYDLPPDNDFNIENLNEADIPSGVNLDGEPLTDAELRELERMERKGSFPEEPVKSSKESKDSKDQRSPKRRREKSKSRDRSKDRSSRYSRDKKYSKRRSSSSSSSSRSKSRSRSSSSSSKSSRSSSRSRSDSRKKSKKVQRKR